MKSFTLMMGMMFAMSAAACGGKKEGEAGGSDLPASCKKYLETAKACAAEAGEAGKSLAEGLAIQEKAWGRAGMDAAALEAGCGEAAKLSKQMMAQSCPKVKWE